MTNITMLPVAFESDQEVVDLISNLYDHEGVHKLVELIDIHCAGFSVSKSIVKGMLSTLKEEFEVVGRSEEWEEVCKPVIVMLENFE